MGARDFGGAPALPKFVRLDFGLEVWRGLEANRFSGLDFHRITGPRVHTFAGLGFLYGKGAKAWQRKTTGLFQFFDNRLD
jgi:hypothetical protein